MITIPETPTRAIVVHGGVFSAESAAILEALKAAAVAGFSALDEGPVAAVTAAVASLESTPLFNAGYGSALNSEGVAEMDAGLMDGASRRVGAVVAMRRTTHPIKVARVVLEETNCAVLAREGADRLAASKGLTSEYPVAPERLQEWKIATSQNPLSRSTSLAGGLNTPTLWGRSPAPRGSLRSALQRVAVFSRELGGVGDTPLPGAGYYASERGASAASGYGESFIELLLAREVDSLLAKGLSAMDAAEAVIVHLTRERMTPGGMVVVDRSGHIGVTHNCPTFPIAALMNGHEVNVALRRVPRENEQRIRFE